MATKFDKGIGIPDTRAAENDVSWQDKSMSPFFTNKNMPSTFAGYMAGITVKGWTGNYTTWELAGPAGSATSQMARPLYVRGGHPTNGWGAWRQIYDSSNKPALTSLSGTLALGHGGTGGTTAAAAFKNIVGGAKVVLYDNASGTNGTITLSQSAANYNHMRIHTKTNYGHGSLDVPNPNGKDVLLLSMATENSGVTTMYFIQQSRYISGTTISVNHSGYAWMVSRSANSNNTGVNAENYMYVVRVEAWNE